MNYFCVMSNKNIPTLKLFQISNMRLFYFALLLVFSHNAFSQSYIRVFRQKGHSPSSEFVVTFNGREIVSLVNGQKLEYKLFSSGEISIDVSADNISKESQSSIRFEVEPGETYYIELGINEYLELYSKKVNVYQGKSKFDDNRKYRKTDALVSLKEDAFDPIIAGDAANREILTPEDYDGPVIEEEIGIRITQPPQVEGEIYEFFGEELVVKGIVSNGKSIDEISVNGQKAEIIRDSIFEVTILVDQFLENDISVKAFTKSGKFFKTDFRVKRALSEYDLAKRERQGKDYALIFATNEFDEFKNLTNPIFDADRIAEELVHNYGFEVDKNYNLSQKDIYLTIKEYSKKAYHPDDQLFVFFAGHGDFDYLFSEGYVVCKDSKEADEARSTYISHSNLRTIINSLPCKHLFLVMDVCFGGTFDPVVASRGGGDEYSDTDRQLYIERKMKYKTRLYLTSGGKEYVPDGRPGMHSPFAKNFIQALLSRGGSDGILTFGEVLQHIEKTSPVPQSGEFGENELGSDFLFIVK